MIPKTTWWCCCATIYKAYDAGKELQTAIDTLDQSAFSRLEHYELLKGGNASRVYLEMES